MCWQASSHLALHLVALPVRGNVDAVQELTDILLLDSAGLVDQRGGATDELDVGAVDHDLVLRIRLRHFAVTEHVDLAHDLLPEEVADLARLASVLDRHVDGEMGVSEAHNLLNFVCTPFM